MKYPVVIRGGLAILPNYPRDVMDILTFRKYNYHEKTYSRFPCYTVQRVGGGTLLYTPRRFPFLSGDSFSVRNESSGGFPFADTVKVKRSLSVNFAGVNQEDFVQCLMGAVQDNGMGGYGVAPPGCGKTLMGLELARRFNRSTLIIVSREYQISQYMEEAETSYKGLRLGVYRGKRRDGATKKTPIVIGMINSLCKERRTTFFKKFGLVIIDEAQHLPADTWLQTFSWLQSEYIIGLTATLVRTDGLEELFRYLVGDILIEVQAAEVGGGIVWQVLIPTSSLYLSGDLTRMQVAKKLMGSGVRTRILAEIVSNMYRKGRDFFVFADIKKHLEDIKLASVGLGIPVGDTGCYFSGVPQRELQQMKKSCRALFVTYQMASEGFNAPRKDSMLCATPPISNLKQLKGRVTRVYEGKPEPYIIDPVDQVPFLQRRAQYRRSRWEQAGMSIKSLNWRRS